MSLEKISGIDWLIKLQGNEALTDAAVTSGSGLMVVASDAEAIAGTSNAVALTPEGMMDALGQLAFPIVFDGQIDKYIDFAGADPDYGSQEDAFIGIGSYTSAFVVADTSSTFIPIQVNLSSTGNLGSAGNQVAAARLRVDTDTNTQPNTATSCLQLRSDIGTNVYAATCLSASLNFSAACAMPVATAQGIYVAITGASAITCPNNVNVLEAVYKQTTGGGGVDNVAELACNASGCTLTNILELINYAGTCSTVFKVSGAFTQVFDFTGVTTAIAEDNKTAPDKAGTIKILTPAGAVAYINYYDGTLA